MSVNNKQMRENADFAIPQDNARLLAFLVDGDDAMASLFQPWLEEVSKYGISIIRRACSDWTQPTMQS